MQSTDELKHLTETLAEIMVDMSSYLDRLERGCEGLSGAFLEEDKALPLDALSQIMEGLSYYQKMLLTAADLLAIDMDEELGEKISITTLNGNLLQTFSGIFEAVESEDYSMADDLVGYDLLPVIRGAQQILKAVQQRYLERVA
jgi:hypothetical protein